jgi:hypothetical protein
MYQSAARCVQAYATGNKNISQLMIAFKADAPKYNESVL